MYFVCVWKLSDIKSFKPKTNFKENRTKIRINWSKMKDIFDERYTQPHRDLAS